MVGRSSGEREGLSIFCIIEPLDILQVFETAIRILHALI